MRTQTTTLKCSHRVGAADLWLATIPSHWSTLATSMTEWLLFFPLGAFNSRTSIETKDHTPLAWLCAPALPPAPTNTRSASSRTSVEIKDNTHHLLGFVCRRRQRRHQCQKRKQRWLRRRRVTCTHTSTSSFGAARWRQRRQTRKQRRPCWRRATYTCTPASSCT